MIGVILLFMFAAGAGTLIAVGVKNILHAIFGLAIALLSIAGLFLTLGSPFVAAMEILIYVGGITVAMIFAVMLSTVIPHPEPSNKKKKLAAFGASSLFFLAVGSVLVSTEFPATAPPMIADAWGVAAIGEALLNRYNLVFETLSVVLLLAIVGAIVISSRDSKEAGQ